MSGFFSKLIPQKGDSPKMLAGKIFFLTAAAALIVSVIIIINYYLQQMKNRQLVDEMAAEHTTVITQAVTTAPPEETETTVSVTEPPPLVVMEGMEKLLEENSDTAGWIIVDGTEVDNVAVQCDDNDFYLDHDFYGGRSQPGTVFVDYRNILNDYNEKQSDNIVVYGHNQADGTMFGSLKKYKVKPSAGVTSGFEFYKEHPTIYFSNLYEEYTYKIIALFVIEVEPRHTRDGVIFDYHNFLRFSQKRPYQTFIDNVMERTAVNTGVDVQEGDKFITLSTCSNEFEPSRFVIIGRRVRDGESPEVDTSQASINYDAKEPDYNFIYNS